MNPSPLDLSQYNLTALRIEAVTRDSAPSPKISTDPVSLKNAEVSASINFGVPRGKRQQGKRPPFAVRLTVRVEPSEDEGKRQFPYRIEVGIQGFFFVIHSKDEADAQRLALVNGTSMLYGVIREIVLSNTLRFAAGPLMLPSVHFLDLAGRIVHKPEGQIGASVSERDATKKLRAEKAAKKALA